MKNNRKKLILILIVLAVILLVLIITTTYIKKHRHGEYEIMGVGIPENVHSLAMANFKVLEEFENNSNEKMVESMKKIRDFFTISLPKIKEKIINDSEYNEYYQELNNNFILKYFKMDEENFVKLCEKINSMQSDLSKEYTECDFAWNVNNDGIIITCFYKNGEKIQLEMLKSKSKSVRVLDD